MDDDVGRDGLKGLSSAFYANLSPVDKRKVAELRDDTTEDSPVRGRRWQQ